MSNISRAAIYCPNNIYFEIILPNSLNNQTTIWISGANNTWFYINNTQLQYKLKQINKQLIKIESTTFQNVCKFYFTEFHKTFFPGLLSRRSMLSSIIQYLFVSSRVGFKKGMHVAGVGYKFRVENNILKVNVGYTHLIEKKLPYQFSVKFSRKNTKILLRSKNLSKLTGFAAVLRKLRKPDPYKGKGIRYRPDHRIKKLGSKLTKQKGTLKKKKK